MLAIKRKGGFLQNIVKGKEYVNWEFRSKQEKTTDSALMLFFLVYYEKPLLSNPPDFFSAMIPPG